jgi:hypothetical protein
LLLSRVLRAAARSNPQLWPILLPLLIAYWSFVLLTWIGNPFFYSFLRISRLGRLLLDAHDRRASNGFIICIAFSVLFLIAVFVFGIAKLAPAALLSAVLSLPVSNSLGVKSRKAGHILITFSYGLIFFALIAFFSLLADSQPLLVVSGVVLLLGFFIYQWVANYVTIRYES